MKKIFVLVSIAVILLAAGFWFYNSQDVSKRIVGEWVLEESGDIERPISIIEFEKNKYMEEGGIVYFLRYGRCYKGNYSFLEKDVLEILVYTYISSSGSYNHVEYMVLDVNFKSKYLFIKRKHELIEGDRIFLGTKYRKVKGK